MKISSLEESFTVYQKGMELLKYCNESIDKVEKKRSRLKRGRENWMNFKETLAEKTVHAEDVFNKNICRKKKDIRKKSSSR